jgi:hypothetical protein
MEKQKRKSTYGILSEILKLKFHTELKNSGIEFTNIYKMINLETGRENYLLQFNDTELKFVTTRDFVLHFSRYLQNNIEKLKIQFDSLNNIQFDDDGYIDEVAIEMKYKEVDFYRIKQSELLIKMNEFKSAL